MRRFTVIGIGLAVALIVAGAHFTSVQAKGGPLARPQLWAGCEMYHSIVTPATFKPTSGPFDELYVNPNGFKNGVQLISEVKPGDADFNGGRWHKNVLKAGVDAEKYAGACSIDDIDVNDFQSTDDYFECPVLPMNHGHNNH